MLPTDLRWFGPREFGHPELVDPVAAYALDAVRGEYGKPIELTDDARLPGELPPGASNTSLHYLGRAFDFSYPTTPDLVWRLARAVMRVAEAKSLSVELELVNNGGAVLEKDCTPELVQQIRAAPSLADAHAILQRAIRRDRHAHFGVFPDVRPSRLIVALD